MPRLLDSKIVQNSLGRGLDNKKAAVTRDIVKKSCDRVRRLVDISLGTRKGWS